ncbi:hypothetical protein POTOM_037272 [Populus tomentosa]|uniref:Uncharacterized protein n=1 Tax=Populus tomentosa TaxID=118781 RepID=A0A8X7YWF9_POPTO|nr:hypothetical protein POTOM_037272 [Populus tomentosa]
MFKKKFRFKSPSMDARSTPMGFSGLKDRSVSTRDGSDLNGLFGKTDAGSLKRDSRRKDGNVHLNSVQNEVNKWEKERGDLRKEMGSINALESLTKELHEAVKSHSKKVIVVKKGQLKLALCWTTNF